MIEQIYDTDITKWTRFSQDVELNTRWEIHMPSQVRFSRNRGRWQFFVTMFDDVGTAVNLDCGVRAQDPSVVIVYTASGLPARGQIAITYLASDATVSSGV